MQLVLDEDVLPAWAADPLKRQATSIVFLPAACCVAYQGQFISGDAVGGAYQY